MSWQTETTEIVRYLVGDSSETTYTDEQIQKNILIAARIVVQEISFDTNYTINVSTTTLTPDPMDLDTDESKSFVNLICLKAACMILNSEYQIYSKQSFRITDGPSTVDGTAVAKNLLILAQDRCKEYSSYKINYVMGNMNGGTAVLTPTTSQYVNPRVFN